MSAHVLDLLRSTTALAARSDEKKRLGQDPKALQEAQASHPVAARQCSMPIRLTPLCRFPYFPELEIGMLIRFIHLLFSDKVNIRETTVFTLWVVKLFVGERFDICADAQNRPKRVERVEPAVESERELVQVGL